MRATSQQDVVDALVAVIREGGTPTGAVLARRAGLAERTLLNHFGSVDEIYAIAIDEVRRPFAPPVQPPSGPIEDRFAPFVAARSAHLEEHHRLVLLAHFRRSPALRAGLRTLGEALVTDLHARFADVVADPALLRAMGASCGFAAWFHWRRIAGLAPDAAAGAMEHVLRLVASPAPR